MSPPRRGFLLKFGIAGLGITVVDVINPQMLLAGCNAPNADDCCGQNGNTDDNCSDGFLGLGKNKDEACDIQGATEKDESCGAEINGQIDPDGNCGIEPGVTGSSDKDDACVEGGSEADASCGDCNDNHQTDDTCGDIIDGSADSDELCGHEHAGWPTGVDQDDNCQNVGDEDAGCGQHDNIYQGHNNDEDQGCDPNAQQETDAFCTGAETDDTCSADVVNSSNPDESCNETTTHADEGCKEIVDQDGNCGVDNDEDQCCSSEEMLGVTIWDTDNNCSETDSDQNCTNDGTDESCGIGAELGVPEPDETWPPEEECTLYEADGY